MKVKVKKRNGSIEDFDESKILRVVMAAGLNDEEAQELLKEVKDSIEEKGKSEVTSVQVRDMVIVEIQRINMDVAKKFIWYEKQRDKNFGLDES